MAGAYLQTISRFWYALDCVVKASGLWLGHAYKPIWFPGMPRIVFFKLPFCGRGIPANHFPLPVCPGLRFKGFLLWQGAYLQAISHLRYAPGYVLKASFCGRKHTCKPFPTSGMPWSAMLHIRMFTLHASRRISLLLHASTFSQSNNT